MKSYREKIKKRKQLAQRDKVNYREKYKLGKILEGIGKYLHEYRIDPNRNIESKRDTIIRIEVENVLLFYA